MSSNKSTDPRRRDKSRGSPSRSSVSIPADSQTPTVQERPSSELPADSRAAQDDRYRRDSGYAATVAAYESRATKKRNQQSIEQKEGNEQGTRCEGVRARRRDRYSSDRYRHRDHSDVQLSNDYPHSNSDRDASNQSQKHSQFDSMEYQPHDTYSTPSYLTPAIDYGPTSAASNYPGEEARRAYEEQAFSCDRSPQQQRRQQYLADDHRSNLSHAYDTSDHASRRDTTRIQPLARVLVATNVHRSVLDALDFVKGIEIVDGAQQLYAALNIVPRAAIEQESLREARSTPSKDDIPLLLSEPSITLTDFSVLKSLFSDLELRYVPSPDDLDSDVRCANSPDQSTTDDRRRVYILGSSQSARDQISIARMKSNYCAVFEWIDIPDGLSGLRKRLIDEDYGRRLVLRKRKTVRSNENGGASIKSGTAGRDEGFGGGQDEHVGEAQFARRSSSKQDVLSITRRAEDALVKIERSEETSPAQQSSTLPNHAVGTKDEGGDWSIIDQPLQDLSPAVQVQMARALDSHARPYLYPALDLKDMHSELEIVAPWFTQLLRTATGTT